MVEAIRKLVSGNRRRFHDDQFSLDLTYIIPDRLIAMSYPSSGFESLYRNSIDKVSNAAIQRQSWPMPVYLFLFLSFDLSAGWRCWYRFVPLTIYPLNAIRLFLLLSLPFISQLIPFFDRRYRPSWTRSTGRSTIWWTHRSVPLMTRIGILEAESRAITGRTIMGLHSLSCSRLLSRATITSKVS